MRASICLEDIALARFRLIRLVFLILASVRIPAA